MPHIQRSALVPFSAESMYELVNDVNRYPEFLPGCADSRIDEQTNEHMSAALLVSKAGIKQWFTTKNTLSPGRSIRMQLTSGPFKTLSGGWSFIPLSEDACKIELDLRFEFESRMVEAAFGKVFKALTTNMVNAFTQRAREVYA
ncbi:type II toxin-antitoxin system RatA family toxin [Alteromonas sediminis]|uniref:Type II toxin-antitoxin system RatA family toxin n=1 Tax=Alteromonas sediminis TaxID=2259342 RepID=A0A3N5Y3Y4_9ALTE|nr:type II toxin-antitoxin system RatA family toxin [Alteromonas sediminis]RPJ68722.1 type II toxin-antitoxin system RatA family toxin [Alteromonas sediminis]